MIMRKLFKSVASLFLVPLTRWYLRKKRTYTYKQINISVFPGVFHPGLFSSTLLILDYLQTKVLPGQRFLELGSGTGLISVFAARAQANVMAIDISIRAIKNTEANAMTNGVRVDVLCSDLFDGLQEETFEWIIINPPYYARKPQNESDFAWYCGEDFEYFRKLFDRLGEFIRLDSQVLMILTQGCDLESIFKIGNQAGYGFELLREQRSFFDGKDMLYRISSAY
jgi:release factor glutamine methyltransferase